LTPTIIQYLIVCPMVFCAGFVDAVAGGGGLISLPAYLIAGLPAHYALGTNKLSSSMGTTIATWRYAKSGYIAWKLALCCAVCAIIGSSIGAELALLIDDHIFKIIMLVVLPLTAIYVWKSKGLTNKKEPLPTKSTTLLAMAIALVMGVYDGLYGPGAGTFMILLLTGIARMTPDSANGTAKVINLSTNIAALTVFLINGKVLLPLGLAAGCFSIAGAYLGTAYYKKGGVRSMRPIIILVLSIFFVKVIYELISA